MNLKWILRIMEDFAYEMNGHERPVELLDEEIGFYPYYADEDYVCQCILCDITRRIFLLIR